MNKTRTLQFKLSIIFLAFALLLSLTLSSFSYLTAKSNYVSFYTDKIREITIYAAASVDGDRIDDYLSTLTKDVYYEDLQQQFDLLKTKHDLKYLYIFKPNEADFTYILEAVKEGDDLTKIGALGQKDPYAGSTDLLFSDIAAKRPSSKPIIFDNQFGYNAVAYAPVLNQSGNVVAVVAADLTMEEILHALNRYIASIVAILAVVIAFSVLLLIYAVRGMVTSPLRKLTDSALSFVSGDQLTYQPCGIHTGDELEKLSDAFQQMAEDIQQYIDNITKISAERERIATELSVATSIQRSLLPSIFPAFPERDDFDLHALMEPAKEVGGDFYDFFLINDDRLGVVIADVSGKGIPAALFMMISKTLLKNYALEGLSASEVLAKANNALCENNEASMFVTVFFGILDLKTGHFNYASAGHNPPLLKKQSNPYDWLPVKRSFVLAGMEDMRYTDQEITLDPGDVLLLYTDGVTEALDTAQELFTEQRLLREVNGMPLQENMKGITTHVKSLVDAFADGAEQADDITILVLSRT